MMDSQNYFYFDQTYSVDGSVAAFDGYCNTSEYGSYQNHASNDSFSTNVSSTTNYCNTNTVSYTVLYGVSPCPVENLSDQFDLLDLINKAYCEVQQDIKQGIKADYYKCKCKVCKWLQASSSSCGTTLSPRSRGRPEDEKEYEGQNIWRNNWIYRQKKSIEDETKKAKRNEIFKINESLNDEYFNLCLEYISLWENLCPHNRATLENIKQNPDLIDQQEICSCLQNCKNGRF